MRLASVLAATLLAALWGCGSSGGGSSGTTGGGGPGGLCANCQTDGDCVLGSSCVVEGDSTGALCAAPCNGASRCDDPNASCIDLSAGKGQLNCYPTAGSCVGFVPTGSSSTTSVSPNTSSSGGTSGSCTPDSYASYGAMFMTVYCLPCHDPSNAAYFPPDCTTQAGIQGDLTRIKKSIDTNLMPIGYSDGGTSPPALSASEVMRVDAWLGCGAP